MTGIGHRTIPQRLNDHDRRFEEQEKIIADLLARLDKLEAPKPKPRKAVAQ